MQELIKEEQTTALLILSPCSRILVGGSIIAFRRRAQTKVFFFSWLLRPPRHRVLPFAKLARFKIRNGTEISGTHFRIRPRCTRK